MRILLAKAAGAALLVLTVGACASTVPGSGNYDATGPIAPTATSSADPTASPTGGPTGSPTSGPSDGPTGEPSDGPTGSPTGEPSDGPTGGPTDDPTTTPDGGPADSEQEAVADVAERWYHALGEKDAQTVCGLMTPAAQRRAGSGGSCVKSVQDATFSADQRELMRRIQVDPAKVRISGDTAAVPAGALSVDGRASTAGEAVKVARAGGDWLIDDIG